MCTKLREIFWPELDDWTPADRVERLHVENRDVDEIRKADWSGRSAVAIMEAHRITDVEEERRKTAESKASNLLVVAVALIPLMIYLNLGEGAELTVLGVTEFVLLLIGTVYLGNSVRWAFRVVSVGNYHSVYPSDLVDALKAGQDSFEENVVEKLLCAVRRNQETVNQKVGALKIAHMLLIRAFFVLLVLLLGQNVIH